jgi:hypothetical protein
MEVTKRLKPSISVSQIDDSASVQACNASERRAILEKDNAQVDPGKTLLNADAARADWRKVARIVLHIDPDREPDRARHAFDGHLARAKWMTEHGYRHLLRGGALR